MRIVILRDDSRSSARYAPSHSNFSPGNNPPSIYIRLKTCLGRKLERKLDFRNFDGTDKTTSRNAQAEQACNTRGKLELLAILRTSRWNIFKVNRILAKF